MPSRKSQHPSPLLSGLRSSRFALLVLLMGVLNYQMLTANTPATLAPDSDVRAQNNIVVLEPEKWIGLPCPLLKHLSAPLDIASGPLTLLLVHPDCPKCQELLMKCEVAVTTRPISKIFQSGLVIVEVPSLGQAPSLVRRQASEQSCLIWTSLRPSYTWYVRTPVAIKVVDGLATAWTSDPEEIMIWVGL